MNIRTLFLLTICIAAPMAHAAPKMSKKEIILEQKEAVKLTSLAMVAQADQKKAQKASKAHENALALAAEVEKENQEILAVFEKMLPKKSLNIPGLITISNLNSYRTIVKIKAGKITDIIHKTAHNPDATPKKSILKKPVIATALLSLSPTDKRQ